MCDLQFTVQMIVIKNYRLAKCVYMDKMHEFYEFATDNLAVRQENVNEFWFCLD